MRIRKILALAGAFFLLAPVPDADARSRKSSRNPAVTRTRNSASKTLAGRTSGKKGKRGRSRIARRSGPPRQAAPTRERYAEIQKALADRGYYSGPQDGIWTAECIDALRRFQADRNLVVDGKLGALSLIGLGLGPQRGAEPEADVAARPSSEPAIEP